MDKKMDNDSLVTFSYDKLKEGIIVGDFAPGEKLRIEKLKSYLGIGPTPIREALSRLTASGLIEAAPNRGFYVRRVSLEEVHDIYATFLKIELLAMEEAMKRGDSSWEAGIIASLYKLSLIEKSASPVFKDWLAANYEFHYSIVSGCKSPTLLKIRADLYQLFDRYCHLSITNKKATFHATHKDHEALAKAIISRDFDNAALLMTRHLKTSLNLVVEKLEGNTHGKN